MAYEPDTDLNQFLEHNNIAETLDQERLDAIAAEAIDLVEMDIASRSDWEERNKDWLRLASQIQKNKTFPWRGASNVKYPLMTTASMQFHARAHQQLMKSSMPVFAKVLGKDPDGSMQARADRVAKFMSTQVLHLMDTWAEDMDRLLFILPVVGLVFKKTYYSPTRGQNVSELVLPQDLIINYHATDFERARKTHRIYMDQNEMVERVRDGTFLDLGEDLVRPSATNTNAGQHWVQDEAHGFSEAGDEEKGDIPHTLFEVHWQWDLDEDGYKEPYIITIDYASEKVLRIVARWRQEDLEEDDKGQILKIRPTEYFTRYPFLPDTESPIYGTGFGVLLGPLNEAINTNINQLLDAGTLNNLQAGFLARGIRVGRGGMTPFRPGEWKTTTFTGDDIRKGVFPLPVKEPSTVLFQLLGLLIESGEKVGSIANDIMMGKSPGQNQPYSTTMAVLEQGLQVFVGIYKRIFRALSEEYKKLYRLNRDYLEDEVYLNLLDDPQAVGVDQDFTEEGLDIVPAADPDIVSEAQKLIKAGALVELITMGFPLNRKEAMQRILEAQGHPDLEKLMQAPPPQPTVEQQIELKKLELEERKAMAELTLKSQHERFVAFKDYAKAQLDMAKAQTEGNDLGLEMQKMQMEEARAQQEHARKMEEMIMKQQHQSAMDQQKLQMQQQSDQLKLQGEQAKAQSQMAIEQDKAATQMQANTMGLQQQQEQHEQKMAQQKEMANASTQQSGARQRGS